MALFDWGTYNGLTKLESAELLGMKLTEIPPYDFTRKKHGEEYFKNYSIRAKRAFTTVTAHAPYYSLIPRNLAEVEKIKRILLDVARKAELAGAEILNLHIGGKTEDFNKNVEVISDIIKYLINNTKNIKFSLETTYTRFLFGSIEEIKAVIESVNSDRVLISLQLENDWMREFEVFRTGQFHRAGKLANEEFWYEILKKGLELGNGYLSLRFSQITGIKLRGIVVKKRTPLGMGYPDLDPLAKAIAKLLIRDIYEKDIEVKAHIIYTGPTQTKYVDTIKLYSKITQELVPHLK